MTTLIVDFGTYTTKAGLSHSGKVDLVYYSQYVVTNGQMTFLNEGNWHNFTLADVQSIFSDLQQICDESAVTNLFRQLISDYAAAGQISISKVLLLFPRLTDVRAVESIQSVLAAQYNCTIMYDQATPYELYSQGLTSGLLFNFSDTNLYFQAVIDGLSAGSASHRKAGRYLHRLLQQQALQLTGQYFKQQETDYVKNCIRIPEGKPSSQESSQLLQPLDKTISPSTSVYLYTQVSETMQCSTLNSEAQQHVLQVKLPDGRSIEVFQDDVAQIENMLWDNCHGVSLVRDAYRQDVLGTLPLGVINLICGNLVASGGSAIIQGLCDRVAGLVGATHLYRQSGYEQSSSMRLQGAAVLQCLHNRGPI